MLTRGKHDHSAWRSSTKSGVQKFELSRISEAKAKRQRHKEARLTVGSQWIISLHL